MGINGKIGKGNEERTVFGILLTVSFCHLLDDTMHSMLPAVYPMLKEEFGLSFFQIGIITLVLQLTSSIIQPFVGLYADRHHGWWQLPVSMVFTLIGIFMLSYADSFLVILLSVSLFGLGSSIFHPQGSQVAQQASGGRNGLAQSIFQVGGNGGFAIGPLFAALIVIPVGLSGVRWFAFIALLLAFILVYIGKWHVRQLKQVRRRRRPQWTTAKSYTRRQIYGFVFILFVLMFSKNFYTESMTSYFTFFLIEKFGVSIQYSQLCLFVFLAAEVVGTLLGGWIGDRYGRKYVIWFSIFGAAPFTILAPLCGKPCRYGCSVSRYRSHHSLGLFRHIGLCHRPHAQSYRDDSRYLLWAVVWSWWAGQFVLRLAGRPDKYSFCLQSQHIAPVVRHYGHLPAKDEACMSRRLSVC